MSKPRDADSFTTWFNRQGILHFAAHEFTDYFNLTRRGVTNSPPAKRLWENILPTIRLADDMRDHFGKSCTLHSSYRSEAYNRRCGGAKFSQHKAFRALDLTVKGVSPKRVADYFYKRRREGDTVAIGRYKTFTHIDTRGNNASWGRN